MGLRGVLFAGSHQEVAVFRTAPDVGSYDKAFEVGALTNVEVDDLTEAVLGERLVSTVSGDGPFLVHVPPPLVDALATIDQPKRSYQSPSAVISVLNDLDVLVDESRVEALGA